MKKLVVTGLISLALFGCSQTFDQSFNEEIINKASTSVIESLNQGQYGVITQIVSDELQEALSPEIIESTWSPLSENLGAYQGIVETKVVPNQDSATSVMIADYENGQVQLTMTYNKDMELIGFYLK